MKIGFIGTGNMGTAMIKGSISSKFIDSKNINIFDLNMIKCEELSRQYGVKISKNEKDIVKNSDIIVLAIKPNIYSHVLSLIEKEISNEKIILTIAAGFSIQQVQEIIGKNKKVVRTMPNTPAQILEGMTAVSFSDKVEKEDKKVIFNLLESFGKVEEIDEKLMHVFTAISGSLPAYVYTFIEALADGGVLEGMPRDKAYTIISQAIQGSAKMILETGKHPGVLKDEVTSPGGTTIEALKILENGNFRGTIINAISGCTEKSKKLSKK